MAEITDSEDRTSFVRALESGGKELRIRQLYVGDVGCVVWDAAIVLCKFLENSHYFPHGFWNGMRVLDIGSETGVAGLAAGVLGADVTLTDLPQFVSLMQSNIDSNQDVLSGKATAKTLIWGQDVSSFPKPDAILMSDVVYYEESLDDLLKTLLGLCGAHTKVIMSYEERTTGNKPEIERKFFQMMKNHFDKIIVPFDKLHETFRSSDIHVLLFSLRN